jgi:hypothetical protein
MGSSVDMLTFAKPGFRRRAQLSDSLAVGMRDRNAPSTCREETVLQLGHYAVHYKHARTFLEVNKLFKRLAITVDVQNVSLLLLNLNNINQLIFVMVK